MTESIARRNNTPIKVYVLTEERKQIEENAKKTGLSASNYLREVGQGYKVQGIVDAEQVRELARINGDLGRLGGLLKLWLTDDRKAQAFGPETIRAVLNKIESTQLDMTDLMTKIMQPRKD